MHVKYFHVFFGIYDTEVFDIIVRIRIMYILYGSYICFQKLLKNKEKMFTNSHIVWSKHEETST